MHFVLGGRAKTSELLSEVFEQLPIHKTLDKWNGVGSGLYL